MSYDAIDTFAGPGGWSEAIRMLGLTEVGFELDAAACATRTAAGHPTVRADVSAFPVRHLAGRFRGYIGSPPCGTFSAAGKQEGVGDMARLHQALDDLAAGRDTRAALAEACSDPRTPLVVEPLRYVLAIRPEWIALEQVPAVLPLWGHIARILRGIGYSAWCGILNAADYGVPQTRQRAILIASRVRAIVPPEPTHSKAAEPDTLFGPGRQQWMSMAEALGWLPAGIVNTRGDRTTPGGNEFSADRPSWALTEKTRSWMLRLDPGAGGFAEGWTRDTDEPSPTIRLQSQSWVLSSGQSVASEGRAERELDEPAVSITGRADLCSFRLRVGSRANATSRTDTEPAPTLLFGHHLNDVAWTTNDDWSTKRHITVQEAAILQTFPADYPWQGTKTKKFLQVGNAVPPRLAAAVIGAATGLDWQSAVEREYAREQVAS